MIKYFYYTLLIFYSILLIRQVYFYLTKPKPTGPDSMPWALGIIYTILLGGIIITSFLLAIYEKYILACILICTPVAFVAMQRIPRIIRAVYLWLPTLRQIPPLQLRLNNISPWKVHIEISSFRGSKSLFTHQKTFDFELDPNENQIVNLSQYETKLLVARSSTVIIRMFEQVFIYSNDAIIVHEIQPCFNTYNETPEAFGTGNYTILIDEDKELTRKNGRDHVIERLQESRKVDRGKPLKGITTINKLKRK